MMYRKYLAGLFLWVLAQTSSAGQCAIDGVWENISTTGTTTVITVNVTAVPGSGFVLLDGIEGQNWAEETDGLKFGLRKCIGGPFWLKPAEPHRFFFLWHGNIMNDADIEAEMKVQISYRPRYASL